MRRRRSILGGKARALMHGRYHVSVEDIHALATPILRHRIITNFYAEVGADDLGRHRRPADRGGAAAARADWTCDMADAARRAAVSRSGGHGAPRPDWSCKARTIVEGFLSGLHRSPLKGFSVEFAEYRQYLPGDDLSTMDWKVYARTDRHYVKKFEEETNLACHLLLDVSALDELRLGRHDQAANTDRASPASLAYLMNRQRDAVGLMTFDDRSVGCCRPSARPGHLRSLLLTLDRLKTGARTDVARPLHQLADALGKRGLVVLISDLLDDPARVIDGLKHFRFRGTDVIVFHVLDHAELTFPFERRHALPRSREWRGAGRESAGRARRSTSTALQSLIETYRRRAASGRDRLSAPEHESAARCGAALVSGPAKQAALGRHRASEISHAALSGRPRRGGDSGRIASDAAARGSGRCPSAHCGSSAARRSSRSGGAGFANCCCSRCGVRRCAAGAGVRPAVLRVRRGSGHRAADRRRTRHS